MSIETFLEKMKSEYKPNYSLKELKSDRKTMIEEGYEDSDLIIINSLISQVESKFFNPKKFWFFEYSSFNEEIEEGSELYNYIESFGFENLHQFFASFLKYDSTISSNDYKEGEGSDQEIKCYSGDGIIVLLCSTSDFSGSFDEILVSLK